MALQEELTGPASTIPLQNKLPIVILAIPRRNPYLKPVIGSKLRFVIIPTSSNQFKTEGVASQLQECSSDDS